MSFIYNDKNLINSLLDAAEKSVKKIAQEQVVQIPTQAIPIYELAKKLALNLQNKINPEMAASVKAPIQFNDNNAQIKPLDVKTLGNFLQWAYNNGITWDGVKVAWPYNDNEAQTDSNVGLFTTHVMTSGHGTERNPDRSAKEKEFNVNKNELIALLTYLRGSKEAKDNKVLEVMLGGIINQVNEFLPKENKIQPLKEHSKTETSQFKDDEEIDGFILPIFDINNPFVGIVDPKPYFNGATFYLKYGDIKNAAAFESWIRKNKITGIDKKDPFAPDGNPCPIIQILYKRATYLSSIKSFDEARPNFSALMQAYLKNITQFFQEFKFEGKSCAIAYPSILAAIPSSLVPSETKPEQIMALASQIATLKPFSSNSINFENIVYFLDQYTKLVPGGEISDQVNQVKAHIVSAKMNTVGGRISTFPMQNMTAELLRSYTLAPWPSHITNLVNDLVGAILFAGQVYDNFITNYGEKIRRNTDAYNNMMTQKNREWQANVSQLQQLKRDVANNLANSRRGS